MMKFFDKKIYNLNLMHMVERVGKVSIRLVLYNRAIAFFEHRG